MTLVGTFSLAAVPSFSGRLTLARRPLVARIDGRSFELDSGKPLRLALAPGRYSLAIYWSDRAEPAALDLDADSVTPPDAAVQASGDGASGDGGAAGKAPRATEPTGGRGDVPGTEHRDEQISVPIRIAPAATSTLQVAVSGRRLVLSGLDDLGDARADDPA